MKKKEAIKYLLNASNRHEAVLQDLDIQIKSNMKTFTKMILDEARARMEMQEEMQRMRGATDFSPVNKKDLPSKIYELLISYSYGVTDQTGCKLLVVEEDDFNKIADEICSLLEA